MWVLVVPVLGLVVEVRPVHVEARIGVAGSRTGAVEAHVEVRTEADGSRTGAVEARDEVRTEADGSRTGAVEVYAEGVRPVGGSLLVCVDLVELVHSSLFLHLALDGSARGRVGVGLVACRVVAGQ